MLAGQYMGMLSSLLLKGYELYNLLEKGDGEQKMRQNDATES